MKILVSLVLVAVLCSSCIPTIIGASVYKSSKTREAKEKFIAQFNQTNIERETAGLAPLDLCTEKYHFDKKWADNDPVCEARIIAYEGGNVSALGHPEIDTSKISEEEPNPNPDTDPEAPTP